MKDGESTSMATRHFSANRPIAVWLGGLSLLALTVGSVGGSPYEAIVGRNVFGLKPAPIKEAAAAPPPAATTFKLLGISSILDRRQVMIEMTTAARPPEAQKIQSYLLSEGQRDGEIEVVEIDAATGTVKLKNNDVAISLNMKDDAKKPAIGAALPASVGGAPPPPPLPGMSAPPTAPSTTPAPGGNNRTIPTRSLRASPMETPAAGTINLNPEQQIAAQRTPEETAILQAVNAANPARVGPNGVRLPRFLPSAQTGGSQ